MALSTYPNKFTSDGTFSDIKFIYSFLSTISYDLTLQTESDISNSIYSKNTTFPSNDTINVKLGENIDNHYSFSGIYLSVDRDIIDNNTYDYAFIIECTNKTSGSNYDKLFISIPITISDEESSLNTLFDANASLSDLNQYIPSENPFYTYTTTGLAINSQVIVYKDSTLKIKEIESLSNVEPSEPFVVTTPLTISSNKAVQVNYISSSNSDNIYISCQPIDDINASTELVMNKNTGYTSIVAPFILPLVTFIMIFGILYIILIYKSKKY
jgi:hypothetical protein